MQHTSICAASQLWKASPCITIRDDDDDDVEDGNHQYVRHLSIPDGHQSAVILIAQAEPSKHSDSTPCFDERSYEYTCSYRNSEISGKL